LRRQKKRTKENATQLPAYSCASQIKMGRAKLAIAQTVALLIHFYLQMLGAVRMGIRLLRTRYRIVLLVLDVQIYSTANGKFTQ
jgi:hypothetical protein